jgi:branched-chain amino acid transport system substrate-binding protein
VACLGKTGLRTFVCLPVLLLGAAALAGCGGGSGRPSRSVTVAVNAPFSQSSYVGHTILNGVRLAAHNIDANGGIQAGDHTYTVKVEHFDNELSTTQAIANVRQAVASHDVAIVDEGTGINGSWPIANSAGVPMGIVYQGGEDLVNAKTRPNVFRIAPTDEGLSFRLASYMIPKHLKIAIITDDSLYGTEGSVALHRAFALNKSSVTSWIEVPTSTTDASPQVVQAKESRATALLVWGGAATIAKVLLAARSSGWNVPVYAPPSAEDPLLRQDLANHPDWLNGLIFASSRMTAEAGPAPFDSFMTNFDNTFGPQFVGVKTSSGKQVIQPPDYAMYAYDFMNIVAAAITKAGGPDNKKALMRAMQEVTIRGVNGDERGFSFIYHEGVVDDDVYFARFENMTFRPVKDDALSATLPVIPQTK